MTYITTTNLRTQTSQVVADLKKGNTISLIHRSKVVGFIQPLPAEPAKSFDDAKFDRLVSGLNLPKTTPTQRQQRYKSHLRKRYGKGIS